MAIMGHQTAEVQRRYGIVDEAMIREAAVKMNRGARVRRATAHFTAQSLGQAAEGSNPQQSRHGEVAEWLKAAVC